MLGASGAIAAVLSAYFVLFPNSTDPHARAVVPDQIPAWVYLGGWFLYQFFVGNYALSQGRAVAVVSRSSPTSEDSPSGPSSPGS